MKVTMKPDRSNWPLFVRFSLTWVPSRRAAWIYFWFCIYLAMAGTSVGVFGMLYGPEILSICSIFSLFAFSAYCYYYSIHWVDENGSWK